MKKRPKRFFKGERHVDARQSAHPAGVPLPCGQTPKTDNCCYAESITANNYRVLWGHGRRANLALMAGREDDNTPRQKGGGWAASCRLAAGRRGTAGGCGRFSGRRQGARPCPRACAGKPPAVPLMRSVVTFVSPRYVKAVADKKGEGCPRDSPQPLSPTIGRVPACHNDVEPRGRIYAPTGHRPAPWHGSY